MNAEPDPQLQYCNLPIRQSCGADKLIAQDHVQQFGWKLKPKPLTEDAIWGLHVEQSSV